MSKKLFNSVSIAIIAVGAIIGTYLWNDLKTRPDFSTLSVKKGNIQETLSLNGKIAPVESVDLGFERGGKVTKLNCEVGDLVKAGEVLAQSNDADLAAQLNEAVAQKSSATAVLQQYQELTSREKYKLKALKNSDTTFNDKKAQEQQIDAQKYQVQSQEALVQAANDNVASIKAQMDKSKIIAPFDGIISRRDIDLGEVAESNSSVITLISPDKYEIDANASQIDVDRIQIGDEASFSLYNDSQKLYKAKITKIDPAQTDVNGVSNYKVTLEIEGNLPDLRSGMDAAITLVAQNKNNVLLVPEKAVFEENGQKFVYVMHNQLREKQEVKTGIYEANSMVEITSGLKEGDEILVLNK
jgi:HlyD family secretion protein